MLFNSVAFLIFFAAFITLWPLLRRRRNVRWGYLVAASFFFYGWWDWRFLFLIVGSGMVNFLSALAMQHWRSRRRLWLVVAVAGNVGVLAVYKYLDFLIQNVNWLAGALGATWRLPMGELILPIGISFYTFQGMSYALDTYRGDLVPTRNILHFFAYLSMFPQLVAGPIVRAAHLVPQLLKRPTTTEPQRWEGLKLIVYGYFKKCVVADTIAPVVREAVAMQVPLASGGYWWVVMLLFSYQIYCDFSGYSDIARGLGRWMGYDFPVNFDHPYIASSFRDFWRRWHISLSTWFRDYVYIPLGGGRKGKPRAHLNMILTMVISGLWHGANWTFVSWGAAHAACLSIERITNWPRRLSTVPIVGRHITTLLIYLLVVVAWVFFLARTFPHAIAILAAMFDVTQFHPKMIRQYVDNNALNVMGLMMLRQLWFHFRLHERRWPIGAGLIRLAQPVGIALLIVACVYLRGPGTKFIYFQF